MVYGWIRNNLRLQTPCLLCQQMTSQACGLCAPCDAELPLIRHACYSCGLPLASHQNDSICGICLKSPPPVHRTIPLLGYAPPGDGLLHGLKFRSQLHIAPMLANKFLRRVKGEFLPQAFLPVPLHKQRLSDRGYNQAVELARPLARSLKLPLVLNALQRTKATLPQTALDADARRKNVRDAFALTRPIPYQHVALVDDVMTTGNTVFALAKLLRSHGVERVDAWVFGRAYN